MKHWFFIVGLGVCAVTGCGRKITPVSSTTATHQKTDSTTTRTSSADTTSSYIERMVQKILRGSTAGVATNTNQLDSLVRVLRAMPQGIDTVYLTDPKQDVALRAFYNKVTGQLMLQCQSRDKIYFEKITEKDRTILLLQAELINVRKAKETTTDTVVEIKKGFWQNLLDTIQQYLVYVLIVVGIMLVGMIDKNFGWVLNIFKKKK